MAFAAAAAAAVVVAVIVVVYNSMHIDIVYKPRVMYSVVVPTPDSERQLIEITNACWTFIQMCQLATQSNDS